MFRIWPILNGLAIRLTLNNILSYEIAIITKLNT